MKIKFTKDFANNWKAGDIVEVKYIDRGEVLVDDAARIDLNLLLKHCVVLSESDSEECFLYEPQENDREGMNEHISILKSYIAHLEFMKKNADEFFDREQADRDIDAFKISIEVLEQESKTEQFAKWVAAEIFDENWEYNKDAFEELACRKLAKLGIVRSNGSEWELVESQESEE